MRKFACIVLLLILHLNALAQIVSFNTTEIEQLKKKMKSDESLAQSFGKFEAEAKVFMADKPNPIDTIRTEGLLKGNPIKTRTWEALKDMRKMYDLAILFRITGKNEYFNQSLNFLSNWAKRNQPGGNPVDDTNLDGAIEAYDLIKSKLNQKQNKLISAWLLNTAQAEMHSKRMTAGRTTAINNWNAHRLKIVGKIGYAIEDKAVIQWTQDMLKKHIDTNLNADGTSWDFKERDAMHYHIYDLEPMLQLAIAIDRGKGPNFYTYKSNKGASIKKSVEWLIPFMNGEKQHEEYVNTKVKFDLDRAKNGEAGFAPGNFFKPEMALPVFQRSVYFDPAQQKVLQMVSGSTNPWENALIEVKRKKKS
ncbi:alginate lyase family protein [Pedobacter sp. AW1-32]|uniref:alginate lyase family protein n=1 Tax=Pedobacter sp. AW1-32 TaxID=3383026 RepID=UPI003FF066B2